jgi:probable F420-dependent oxidoreductase
MQAARVNDAAGWADLAHAAEAAGYATLMIPDHFGRLATFPALMAAAAVTKRITLATYVLNQDWRPPGLLALEAASVHLLTCGRLELGLGAGWAAHEYAQVGVRYDAASVRVARFAEYVQIVKELLAAREPYSFQGEHFQLERFAPLPDATGRPPRILVGGGSPKILAIAGRLADVISISTRASADGRVDMPNIRLAAVEQKLAHIRAAAGDRYSEIELNMTVRDLRVTDDRRAAARALLMEWARLPQRLANVADLTEDDVLESPHEAIGTVDQIVEQLEVARERWDIAYLEVSSNDAEAVAPIMARLAGR